MQHYQDWVSAVNELTDMTSHDGQIRMTQALRDRIRAESLSKVNKIVATPRSEWLSILNPEVDMDALIDVLANIYQTHIGKGIHGSNDARNLATTFTGYVMTNDRARITRLLDNAENKGTIQSAQYLCGLPMKSTIKAAERKDLVESTMTLCDTYMADKMARDETTMSM